MRYQPVSTSLTHYLLLWLLVPLALQCCKSSYTATADSQDTQYENPVSYQQDIRPIMALKCTPCHFPDLGKKKLLHTYKTTRKNIKDIMYRMQLPVSDKKFMPFKQKKEPLTAAEIGLFKEWIAQGMPK